MGSDFTYEDLERINLVDFDYENLGEEMVEGQACYKISALPNSATTQKESGYSKRIYYILKDSHHIAKTDYFNKKGDLSKIYLGKDIKKPNGSAVLRTHTMEMQNLETEHTSIIQFSDFKIDKGIETDGFTVRALEKI